MRTRGWLRGAAKVIALAIMACYGVMLGVPCGHLWFGLFLASSPRAFFEPGPPWSTEVPVLIGYGLLGAATMVWLGVGASNGHFGFENVRAGRSRFRHAASLGATYGAGAGALLSTTFTLNLGFEIASESKMATAPWATSPHWVVLAEVAFGALVGALVGAPLGVVLVPISCESTAAASPSAASVAAARAPAPAQAASAAAVAVAVVVISVLYALAVHFSQPLDGPARTAVLIAASAGLVYFGCIAAFLRTLLPAFGNDAAVFKRLSARAMRWAIAAGMLCGIGIGLRVELYAALVGWDPGAHAAWLAALGGALLGAIAGLAIAMVVMPRTQS